MPEISRFYGVIVYMYYFDHNPPHIHVKYGEFKAIFYFTEGKMEGEMPPRVKKMVLQWIQAKERLLQLNWELSATGKSLIYIEPL